MLACAVVLCVGVAPTHAQDRVQQGPHGDGQLLRVTLEQLRNGSYRLPLRGDEEIPIRFHQGRGTARYGDGATERVLAGLLRDLVAFGDLDGDQLADAAVVVFIDPGGSGTFIHLLAMRDRYGTPVQAAREVLGDRVRVHGLTISRGRIVVTMLAHGPGDGLCCPSVEVRRAFTLQGSRLVPSQLLAVESPLPGEKVASGVEVRGTTSTPPSGEALAYLVRDARGGVIGMGRIPVAAGLGSAGTFAAPVNFLAGGGGPGRIDIVDLRRSDGSASARVSVQVLLAAAADRRPARQQPPPRQIVLQAPAAGAVVGASIEVRGWISTVPFENNLTYRIYREGGVVIDRGWIMVDGDLGERGTFAKSITLAGTAAAGPVGIEVRDVNEADGSLFTSTTVQGVRRGRAARSAAVGQERLGLTSGCFVNPLIWRSRGSPVP